MVGRGEGIEAGDGTGIVLRSGDAKRGAVDQQAFAVLAAVTRRCDPYVLDGAPFQHPAEMHFRRGLAAHAFGVQVFQRPVPRAGELSIEHHLRRTIRRRSIRMERLQKRIADHVGLPALLSSDYPWAIGGIELGQYCDRVPAMPADRVDSGTVAGPGGWS